MNRTNSPFERWLTYYSIRKTPERKVNTMKLVDTAKHTPAPWFIPDRQPCLIAAYPGKTIFEQRSIASVSHTGKTSNFPNATRFATNEDLANAHFICLAVNSHAALVEACRSALAEINQCQAHNFAHPTLEAASEHLRSALEALHPSTKEVQS